MMRRGPGETGAEDVDLGVTSLRLDILRAKRSEKTWG
jgi:hypothetical protein